MKRPGALLALILLALCAAPAGAQTRHLDFPGPAGLERRLANPEFFRPDGSLLFTRGLTLLRLAPGETKATTAWENRPEGVLTPAGGGVFVARSRSHVPIHCCLGGGVSQATLSWYPDPAAPGTLVRECSGMSCQTCEGGWYGDVLGGETFAVLSPGCTGSHRPRPVIRDLANGEERPLPGPLTSVHHLAGNHASGYVNEGTREVAVVDITSGEALYRVPSVWSSALLPDGTLLFTDAEGSRPVFRWRRGEPQPTQLPLSATDIRAAGGSLLMRDGDSPWRVATVDGGPVAQAPAVGTVGNVEFDGRNVAWTSQSCLTQRLHIWDVAGAAPATLPDGCGEARAASLEVSRKRIRVQAFCPARSRPQGCWSRFSLGRPAANSQREVYVAQRPGAKRWVVLGSRMGKARCRRLARTRRWRINIATGDVLNTYPDTFRSQRVVRRNRCGAR